MPDVEWQIRNWLYFTWLSGDPSVEQHVHNLDVMNWAINAHPVKCVGMGGREVRRAEHFGHIFDHFAVDYEYPNDVHVLSMFRQIQGAASSISESVTGTRGACNTAAGSHQYRISGERAWSLPRAKTGRIKRNMSRVRASAADAARVSTICVRWRRAR